MSLTDRLVGSPRLYDRVQRIFGLDRLRGRIAPVLASIEPGTILDVGAGTANIYPAVPASFGYTALDVDERKLRRAKQKFPEVRTLSGDGANLPLADADVDYTLCVDVSHHLSADQFGRLVAELARVTRRKLIFVDAVEAPRLVSKVLWRLDRGSHPRSVEALRDGLGRQFTLQRFEIFTIQHQYVLAVAEPRDVGVRRAS